MKNKSDLLMLKISEESQQWWHSIESSIGIEASVTVKSKVEEGEGEINSLSFI